MKRFSVETAVGLFLVIGFLCFAYISVKLGNVDLFGPDTYRITAKFSSISGLKVGANVEIAGVKIGRVDKISLENNDYQAIVVLGINKEVALQEDCIASIRTAGIIGDKYINITPGGFDDLIPEGGEITETESAINIEELISKYIFENK